MAGLQGACLMLERRPAATRAAALCTNHTPDAIADPHLTKAAMPRLMRRDARQKARKAMGLATAATLIVLCDSKPLMTPV